MKDTPSAHERLRNLAQDLSSARSTREVLELSFDAAMEILRADCGWVCLASDETGSWELTCRRGLWRKYPEEVLRGTIKHLQREFARNPDPVHVLSGRKSPILNDVMRRAGAASWGAVPLKRDGLTIGCMVVSSGSKNTISPSRKQALEVIAWQTGCALARVRAEEQLGGSDREVPGEPDGQGELVCRYLPDGTLIFVNDAYCRFFGRMREDLVGSSFFRGLDERDRELVTHRIDQLVPENPEDVLEVQVPSPSGDLRWVRWTRRAIFDGDGRVIEFRSTGSDITERVTILRALEESERRYRTLVETARDVIFTLDMDFRFTYVSPAVTSVLGYRVQELDSTNVPDTLTESSRKRFLQAYGDLRAAEHASPGRSFSRTEQIEQYHKDGRGVWTEATITFLRDGEDKPNGILMISRDITHRRHVEQMKSDFVTTAAHELRTPLTSILGFSELLLFKNDVTPPESSRYLEYIRKNAERMADIIGDLLDISRIESGEGVPTTPQVVDLLETIEQMAEFYRQSSSLHRIEATLPAGPIEVRADNDKITKLFRNLFDNALRYSPAGGLISLTCESFPEHYLFSIQDEGIGMDPGQAKRVFDPFYRVDASDTAVSGTGLGLTAARNVVEALGGRIWMNSEKGRGTMVEFTLPMRQPTDCEEGSDHEEDPRCG
ncbi:MAG: PAS domain S-box protein [Desulfomonilaceae bacterium]|nr:PAS domain S-box protein [Desulfomonilaceae bacterium]